MTHPARSPRHSRPAPRRRTLPSLLPLAPLALLLAAAAARADEPPAPLADALVAWQMDSAWDQTGEAIELTPVGRRLHVNLPLAGAERDASLARGGNGRVASLRDAALLAGDGSHERLNPQTDQLSLALRLDNPTNHWDVTLFSKHGGHHQLVYNVYAFNTPQGGLDLGVEIGTEGGLGRAAATLHGDALDGWLDIIARYDGRQLELFVNGRLEAASPLTGRLRYNPAEPVVLAGEMVQGRVLRRYSGDIDHAALWDRALTDEEIALLSDHQPQPLYGEPHRLQFHFSPRVHWINDPNGMVYHDGTWHLFFQHNPYGTRWGHMSWGHATSRDLVHWQEQPVALLEEDGIMIFSGSAVQDRHNTSGFADDADPDGPLVAIYTGHDTRRNRQTQDLAYSTDGGRSWTKYAGNPVLDIDQEHFRDPKVFWHEPSERWIMAVALANDRQVSFYGSPNLRQWEHLSDFGPAGAPDVPNWECPDLFELPVDGTGQRRWVLQVDVGGNAVAGGSGAQYFIGQFDGRTFRSDDPPERVRWVDYGADFYAAQSWSDVPADDGRRVWLAWMNNWQYANDIPTSPWRGAMSVPREVRLVERGGQVRLAQLPVRELERLRGEPIELRDVTVAPDHDPLAEHRVRGKALEIVAEFELDAAERFGLDVHLGDGQRTRVGYDAAVGEAFVDRRESGADGFSPVFAALHAAPLEADDGRVRLRILVDHSSVELFAQDGLVTITDRVFPDPESDRVGLWAEGGQVHLRRLTVWPLESIWE